MIRLLERRFEVAVPLDEAWRVLGRVEEWPRWARHIRRVDVSPPGAVGRDSSGCIRLRNGIRSTFRMEEFRPGINWKWRGPFLWLTVHYDHRFEVVDAGRTRLTWTVDGEGFGAGVLGPIFAAIYAKNLDKAIPEFLASIGRPGASATAAGNAAPPA